MDHTAKNVRLASVTGVIVDGVKYDHPELQRFRAKVTRGTTYDQALVHVEVRRHTAAGFERDLCHVRNPLNDQLICIAEAVAETNPQRAATRVARPINPEA